MSLHVVCLSHSFQFSVSTGLAWPATHASRGHVMHTTGHVRESLKMTDNTDAQNQLRTVVEENTTRTLNTVPAT